MDGSKSPAGGQRPDAEAGTAGRGQIPPRAQLSDDPVISVPADILVRYNARVLDPATAAKVADQPAPRPTVYLADRLVVSGTADNLTRDDINAAAAEKQLRLVPALEHVKRRARFVALARDAGHDDAESHFTTTHQLQPVEGAAVVADAWEVLQTFRAGRSLRDSGQQHVGLNHLLTAAKFVHGSPVPGASDFRPSMSYGLAGSGGREPVTWLGRPPARRADADMPCRRPVIAVLDTGVGNHPWFDVGVERNGSFAGERIGLLEDPTDAEALGHQDDPLGGTLDPDTGHGTFIAGLIRQICPDADVLSVKVMHSDGVVAEDVLLEALTLLALRQKTAQQAGDHKSLIDIVSLSLGYYHELPVEVQFDTPLQRAIRRLGELGIIVVVAAGNDATVRPMYPAAFAPVRDAAAGLDRACPPVVAVGAMNPDGSTALFSNHGPWITVQRPGAALVSTFPPAVDGSQQPSYEWDADGEEREGLDPDNFASGFAVWSGTSFATPVFAAELARSIVDGTCGDPNALDIDASVARAWAALEAHTWFRRPS